MCWGKCCAAYLLRCVFTIIQAGIPCKWLDDSQRFLLEHFDTVCNSPSHIYHSALPLSPSSSGLHESYGAEISQEVKVVKGLSAGWGTCSRTVLFGTGIFSLSYWNKIIAVGTVHGSITIIDAVTGSQTAVFSGHTDGTYSVVFASDGRSLVSGGSDRTVKLWDMQTGGVVRTFSGHTDIVRSVSISADYTTIASGSWDKTTRLWNIHTGECHQIIKQPDRVTYVIFSPTDPQYLLFASNVRVWQWNVDGQRAGSPVDGFHPIFSPDGTRVISHHGTTATVWNTDLRTIIAKFQVDHDTRNRYFNFSPDCQLVVATVRDTIYIWDITSSEPCLVKILTGHSKPIVGVAFSSPSSLISASHDQSLKFWWINRSSTDPDETDLKFTSHTSTTIMSISLFVKDGITITSDSDGVVKTWDILTGFCKASFQTPAKGASKRDVQLVNSRLILAWDKNREINVWDVEKGELLLTAHGPDQLNDFKISKDGSRIFSLGARVIQAQSIETGEIISKAGIKFYKYTQGFLTVDGSMLWIHYPGLEGQVWNFGTPGSSPVQLPYMSLVRSHSNNTVLWDTGISGVREKATGKVIFQLSERFGKPSDVQWNGQYLVACFISGEVLVLDFGLVLPQ